jgi:hypothetical protein
MSVYPEPRAEILALFDALLADLADPNWCKRLEDALRDVDALLADPDGANPIDSIRLARKIIREIFLEESNWCKRC